MTRYIQTDECQDVLASLEYCALSLCQTRQSDRAWKWVVLSLHNALQGAVVCHLSGTAQVGALRKTSAKEWLEWYAKDQRGETPHEQKKIDEFGAPMMRTGKEKGQPPREFVASADELFSRLSCSSKRIENGCGEIIEITERQKTAFRRLHSLRNEFSHFSPKGWSIELEYTEETIEDILDVVCLILDDPWPFRHMPRGDMDVLRSTIEEIRSILSRDSAQG